MRANEGAASLLEAAAKVKGLLHKGRSPKGLTTCPRGPPLGLKRGLRGPKGVWPRVGASKRPVKKGLGEA